MSRTRLRSISLYEILNQYISTYLKYLLTHETKEFLVVIIINNAYHHDIIEKSALFKLW